MIKMKLISLDALKASSEESTFRCAASVRKRRQSLHAVCHPGRTDLKRKNSFGIVTAT